MHGGYYSPLFNSLILLWSVSVEDFCPALFLFMFYDVNFHIFYMNCLQAAVFQTASVTDGLLNSSEGFSTFKYWNLLTHCLKLMICLLRFVRGWLLEMDFTYSSCMHPTIYVFLWWTITFTVNLSVMYCGWI